MRFIPSTNNFKAAGSITTAFSSMAIRFNPEYKGSRPKVKNPSPWADKVSV